MSHTDSAAHPPVPVGPNPLLSNLALTFLFLGYWYFARLLERIDLTLAQPAFWQNTVFFFPLLDVLTPLVLFVVEMFSPRVLRHLIPVVAGWWLARQATLDLLMKLYEITDQRMASAMLSHLQRGSAVGDRAVDVKRASFDEQRRQSVLLRVGGPGRIVVGGSDAIVTERNGRFCRVLGSGKHSLRRFESVKAVLDLRPLVRQAQQVPLTTRDGIELRADLTVTFAIDRGDQAVTPSRPYPYSEEAVRKAAYAETVLESSGGVGHWDDVPLIICTSRLKNIVGDYRLDEIIFPDKPENDPRKAIYEDLKRRASTTLSQQGIELLELGLGPLRTPDSVANKHVAFWRADWQRQERIIRAEGEAKALEEAVMARAEAEAALIQAIYEGVHRARREGGVGYGRELIALRLIEALERMAWQAQAVSPPSPEIIKQLNELRGQLALPPAARGGPSPEQA
jgi:regulator of protease activity HflC (stomatin/prohibitin superfamily)